MLKQEWEEIDEFQHGWEFDRFLKWLDEAVAEGVLIRVPVEYYFGPAGAPRVANPVAGPGGWQGEAWFQCVECGERWRMVPPDYGFHGVFQRIDPDFPWFKRR